jgi:hypothetical protein
MFSIVTSGSFEDTLAFLRRIEKLDIRKILETHAQMGVDALMAATPEDSGLAAHSWGYNIEVSNGSCGIVWTNSNIENGFPVALMIQLGHGTGTGGYVHGIDYINPALKPVFDKIADAVWRAVSSA